jgi:hypothetical protein
VNPSRARLISLSLCVIGAGSIWLGAGEQPRPGTRAASLVVLAGVGALLAGRGLFRRVVAVVVVLAGCGLIAGGAPVAVIGGGAAVIGGLIALVTVKAWPVMGLRYERATAAHTGTTDLWTALDRGEDPTER